MVAFLEVLFLSEVVVIVEPVFYCRLRIAIDVRVVLGSVVSHSEAEFQTPALVAADVHGVANDGTCSEAFAFPSLCLAKAYTIYISMDVARDVRTNELPLPYEVVTAFENVVSYLPELLSAPMVPVRTCEAEVGCEVTRERIVFQLHVRAWCPVVPR